jgi:hypothetical protein
LDDFVKYLEELSGLYIPGSDRGVCPSGEEHPGDLKQLVI